MPKSFYKRKKISARRARAHQALLLGDGVEGRSKGVSDAVSQTLEGNFFARLCLQRKRKRGEGKVTRLESVSRRVTKRKKNSGKKKCKKKRRKKEDARGLLNVKNATCRKQLRHVERAPRRSPSRSTASRAPSTPVNGSRENVNGTMDVRVAYTSRVTASPHTAGCSRLVFAPVSLLIFLLTNEAVVLPKRFLE